MALWGIFLTAFIIGFSGAMVPGPMLGIALDGSIKKGPKAGPLIAFGHASLEFILVIVLASGLKGFFTNQIIEGVIGFLGGGYLLWMGFDMVKSSILRKVSLENQNVNDIGSKSLILAGAIVSATNPYFLMWWASAGVELILKSLTIGVVGLIFFYLGHILSDFTWYSLISLTVSKGKKFINNNVYRLVILFLGVFLSSFSVYFIYSGCMLLYHMLF